MPSIKLVKYSQNQNTKLIQTILETEYKPTTYIIIKLFGTYATLLSPTRQIVSCIDYSKLPEITYEKNTINLTNPNSIPTLINLINNIH